MTPEEIKLCRRLLWWHKAHAIGFWLVVGFVASKVFVGICVLISKLWSN